MSDIPKKLLIVMGLAVCIRLVLFGAVLFNFGEQGLFLGDSIRFYHPAVNIVAGHGFSESSAAPYLPNAGFPPLYSFIIAFSLFAFKSVVPAIVFQIMLASLIPFLVWMIAGILTNDNRVRYMAVLLAAFEPQTILWSILLATEVTAIFFLLLGVYGFLRGIISGAGAWRWMALSAASFGLSTLIRPHAQFIVILGFLSLAGYASYLFLKKREIWKHVAIGAALFILTFFAVLTPWLARNWYYFHTVSVASTGLRNIYSGIATSVLTYKTGKEYNDVQESLQVDIKKRYGYTRDDIYTNPALGGLLAREGLHIIRENPRATIGAFAVILNSFFTQDLYLDYSRHFSLIPYFSFGFSPSLVLMKQGPVALVRLIGERVGWYAFIPVLGRVFWIGLTLFWIAGLAFAFKKGGRVRLFAFVAAVLTVYYAFTSLAAGFSDQGRFRYPVSFLMFILASFGWFEVQARLAYFHFFPKI